MNHIEGHAMGATHPEDFPPNLVGRNNGGNALTSITVALEAWRRGLEVSFTSADLERYTVTDGFRSVDFNCSRPESITGEEHYLRLNRKHDTSSILRSHGIPTPVSRKIRIGATSDDALRQIAESIGYPLVLKPNTGSLGRGVHTELKHWGELKQAYAHLCKTLAPQDGIIESHHEGQDYRVLVIGKSVVGAVRRIPAHVLGDGQSTISSLIDLKNKERRRNPFLSAGPIVVDFEVEKTLREQALHVSQVPAAGQYVRLRRVANASAGGDVEDVTDTIPSEVLDTAAKAVAATPGIVVAGVDVLYNAQAPSHKSNYVVIEMNARPHIGVNMYPSIGVGRDAPAAMIDTLFPGTSRPDSPLAKSLRFNVTGIQSAFHAGIASKVALPQLPNHLYPVRQRFTIDNMQTVRPTLSAFRRRRFQSLAFKNGVCGHLSRAENGALHIKLAAERIANFDAILDQLEDWYGKRPTRVGEWVGPVTTSITFDL